MDFGIQVHLNCTCMHVIDNQKFTELIFCMCIIGIVMYQHFVSLLGTSAEKFVERSEKDKGSLSNYDKFRKLLAEKLRQPVQNIDIFSVMNNGIYTDIRYAAHGSPYYPASKLDGVVSMYQTEV